VVILTVVGAAATAVLVWRGSGAGPAAVQPASGLGEVLVDQAPPGYVLDPAASGSLTEGEAAAATTADPGQLRHVLDDAGFSGAESRVWTHGEDFASAFAFRLTRPFGPTEVVDFEISSLRQQVTAYVFPIPSVTGAQGYIFNGEARAGHRTLFCQGVWFARGEWAFNDNTCSAIRPGDIEAATTMAQGQSLLASEGAGTTSPP
jgi:hypothetical protein